MQQEPNEMNFSVSGTSWIKFWYNKNLTNEVLLSQEPTERSSNILLPLILKEWLVVLEF